MMVTKQTTVVTVNNFGRLLLLLQTLIFSSRVKQFLQTIKHQLYKSYKLSQNINYGVFI